ncbi:MAG TPA: magnesium transporter [Nitrospinaceae bacterium]|nr:magnesium transporter [Nitrospinaceae bacterium]
MKSITTLRKDNYQQFDDLSIFPADQLVSLFTSIPKIKTLSILRSFEQDFILKFLDECPEHLSAQWKMSLKFKPVTVGELMQPSVMVLNENKTIEDAITEIKTIHKDKQFTYGMIVDDANIITGVLVFKDVFYHEPNAILKDVCLKNPICLKAEDDVLETFIEVAGKQIPEFPVVDNERKLIGTLRGSYVNEAHALHLKAQSGLMVGASPEEGLDSSLVKCVKSRGPWLLVNLVTAFVAGAVVGAFQETIDQIVLLAMFLPILAGQSGNTGAQALAVLIREMTLGDVGAKITKQLVKESFLGIIHGLVTGAICALVMYMLATQQNNPHAVVLSIIILVSMVASCIVSGLMGAFVPVALKKCGADPAAASSIFLTTGTDVVSMGVMLFLATKFIINA